ncbi:uncharacterized protein LTR77_004161 [Saxophila tyrrhenica]|uniref:Peptidase M14 domain-containing protein n=1 Tax=Saxophila tyrrhenica TaxID=1690608 RepID=A0AAV9PC08_9PEZI|nr:hypothetical protein LTR77_004161 [Saxophila tyrrhenica]
MRFHLLAFLPLALSTVLPRDDAVDYEGYEAFRINTHGDGGAVKTQLSSIDYKQWNYRVDQHLDIAVPAEDCAKFKQLGLEWEQMHKNLGQSIREEKQWKKYPGRKPDELPDDSWFDSYHPYEDHKSFWEDLHAAFPKNSKMISSGTSVQGRDLFGLKLYGSGNHNVQKPAIIWHSNVHAREWITSMTVEYIAYQLIEGYGGCKGSKPDAEVQSLLDTYDFYLIPFVNPDGFVYSQEVDRLWRKNRSSPPPGANQTCYGTDVNRNWPWKWNVIRFGSSPDPCEEDYRGEAPGDTPENQGMTAFIDSIAKEQPIKFYVDWHSYGQYILTPHGWSCKIVAENSEEQVDLAEEVQEVIASVHGTNFTYGPICETLYAVNGGSTDYVYDIAGAEYSWAFEVRDEGKFGFVLPKRFIRPVGEEMWEGVKYAIANM